MSSSPGAPQGVRLYDTTLRDGLGMEGLSLSVEDKIAIARRLDEIGVDYVEGGYPGSNPKDAEFFARMRETPLRNAKLVAFGSTRRAGGDAASDAALLAVLESETPVITLVGKSSAAQVREVLETTEEENLAMIADSVRLLVEQGREVIFDAEHFFDGYADDPRYAIATLRAAAGAGASTIALCDTNGGSLPGRDRRGRRRGAGRGRLRDRHSRPQRRRPRGREHAARRAGGRDAGAGLPERLGRALRQREHHLRDREPQAQARPRRGERRNSSRS